MNYQPQQGYWDGNKFVIPGLPQAEPVAQALIPTAAPVQSPVQQLPQRTARPAPVNQAGAGEDENPGPTSGPSAGEIGTVSGIGGGLATVGAGLSGALGVPGLGIAGNAIGTGIDAYNQTGAMQRAGMAGPGVADFFSGMLHNATFGGFGDNINDTASRAGTQAAHDAHARGVTTDPGGGWMEDDEADDAHKNRTSAVDPDAHARGVTTDPGGGWKEDDEADQDQGADDSVICTELHRQGYVSDEFMALDAEFGKRQPDTVMQGYHWWARPLVRAMQRSKAVTHVVRVLSAPVRAEIAYRMGGNVAPPALGCFMLLTGVWVCSRISAAFCRTRSTNTGLTSKA